jgi:Ca2+-binding EF-hand superfamily protein
MYESEEARLATSTLTPEEVAALTRKAEEADKVQYRGRSPTQNSMKRGGGRMMEEEREMDDTEKVKEVLRIFHAIDVDGSGDISADELSNLGGLGKEEAQALFASIDVDGSGFITVNEMIDGMQRKLYDIAVLRGALQQAQQQQQMQQKQQQMQLAKMKHDKSNRSMRGRKALKPGQGMVDRRGSSPRLKDLGGRKGFSPRFQHTVSEDRPDLNRGGSVDSGVAVQFSSGDEDDDYGEGMIDIPKAEEGGSLSRHMSMHVMGAKKGKNSIRSGVNRTRAATNPEEDLSSDDDDDGEGDVDEFGGQYVQVVNKNSSDSSSDSDSSDDDSSSDDDTVAEELQSPSPEDGTKFTKNRPSNINMMMVSPRSIKRLNAAAAQHRRHSFVTAKSPLSMEGGIEGGIEQAGEAIPISFKDLYRSRPFPNRTVSGGAPYGPAAQSKEKEKQPHRRTNSAPADAADEANANSAEMKETVGHAKSLSENAAPGKKRGSTSVPSVNVRRGSTFQPPSSLALSSDLGLSSDANDLLLLDRLTAGGMSFEDFKLLTKKRQKMDSASAASSPGASSSTAAHSESILGVVPSKHLSQSQAILDAFGDENDEINEAFNQKRARNMRRGSITQINQIRRRQSAQTKDAPPQGDPAAGTPLDRSPPGKTRRPSVFTLGAKKKSSLSLRTKEFGNDSSADGSGAGDSKAPDESKPPGESASPTKKKAPPRSRPRLFRGRSQPELGTELVRLYSKDEPSKEAPNKEELAKQVAGKKGKKVKKVKKGASKSNSPKGATLPGGDGSGGKKGSSGSDGEGKKGSSDDSDAEQTASSSAPSTPTLVPAPAPAPSSAESATARWTALRAAVTQGRHRSNTFTEGRQRSGTFLGDSPPHTTSRRLQEATRPKRGSDGTTIGMATEGKIELARIMSGNDQFRDSIDSDATDDDVGTRRDHSRLSMPTEMGVLGSTGELLDRETGGDHRRSRSDSGSVPAHRDGDEKGKGQIEPPSTFEPSAKRGHRRSGTESEIPSPKSSFILNKGIKTASTLGGGGAVVTPLDAPPRRKGGVADVFLVGAGMDRSQQLGPAGSQQSGTDDSPFRGRGRRQSFIQGFMRENKSRKLALEALGMKATAFGAGEDGSGDVVQKAWEAEQMRKGLGGRRTSKRGSVANNSSNDLKAGRESKSVPPPAKSAVVGGVGGVSGAAKDRRKSSLSGDGVESKMEAAWRQASNAETSRSKLRRLRKFGSTRKVGKVAKAKSRFWGLIRQNVKTGGEETLGRKTTLRGKETLGRARSPTDAELAVLEVIDEYVEEGEEYEDDENAENAEGTENKSPGSSMGRVVRRSISQDDKKKSKSRFENLRGKHKSAGASAACMSSKITEFGGGKARSSSDADTDRRRMSSPSAGRRMIEGLSKYNGERRSTSPDVEVS